MEGRGKSCLIMAALFLSLTSFLSYLTEKKDKEVFERRIEAEKLVLMFVWFFVLRFFLLFSVFQPMSGNSMASVGKRLVMCLCVLPNPSQTFFYFAFSIHCVLTYLISSSLFIR